MITSMALMSIYKSPANLPETIGAHWLQNGVLLAEARLPC